MALEPLDVLRPAPPAEALRARVLAAAREATRGAAPPGHWLDAAVESSVLRRLWRLAMLAAIVAHLWIGSEASRNARRWHLLPEARPGLTSAIEPLAVRARFAGEEAP
jgi:hypothetical protein